MIVGMGEVGRALAAYLNVDGHDVEPDHTPASTIHIAYPYSSGFEETVLAHAEAHQASLVVVHSTVPVGTCDPHGWVHSPVRGRHPRIRQALEVTVKLFGGVNAHPAAHAWPGQTRVYLDARTTEAGKLWELAQFGLQVRVMQAIHEWCDQSGLNPDVVYRDYADDYNGDYVKLGSEDFIRPVLQYQGRTIGGHCVVESMAYLDHPLARIVEHGM